MLALLTFQQTWVWASDETLWTHAASVAPLAPRPWINLALVRLRASDDSGAEWHLARAWARVSAQPPTERDWAIDQIQAAMAQILMGRGQLRAAGQLMRAGARDAEHTTLGSMCRHFVSVCALADSPP